MMWRSASYLLIYAGLVFGTPVFFSCSNAKSPITGKDEFSKHHLAYYYKLIAFNTDTSCYQPGSIACVNAVFKTQSDSIFWDSHNNLNDQLYVKIDSNVTDNFFKYHVSKSCPADSAALLIKTKDFFRQAFNCDTIPFFSKNDTVVKINFKVDRIYSKQDFQGLCVNLQKEETTKVNNFFKSRVRLQTASDPLGFYWIERPADSQQPAIEPGNSVTISYKASFLDGRFLEKSATNFEYIYGTPDQLLKGLNYVIGKLKLGQNAKILLPSRLAFGEYGSGNGIVPPYTPIIYEVKIIDVKQIK